MIEKTTKEFSFGKAALMRILKRELEGQSKIQHGQFTTADLFVTENDHADRIAITVRMVSQKGEL